MTHPSSQERWKRVRLILERALEHDGQKRAAYLTEACADDAALRGEIDGLLAAEHGTGLTPPTGGPALFDSMLAAEDPLQPGQSLGPWRLERVIGSGGMGQVWLAQRSEGGFEQRAALKVVKRGMDTDDVLKRFRRERELLASLEHPRIARIFDGGATSDGRPWLAMEYVEGETLERWCDARSLGLRERIELFLRVLDAVAFAHSLLVVHRDLKPGNILIDQRGEPKLLDFGIAKLLATEGPEQDRTLTGKRLLTPAYASPEQRRGEPATRASDVYSLGVILYELATGTRPWRGELTSDTSAPGMELEPERPSTRVAAASPSTKVAGLSAERLQRELRGDLDTILLTSLRADVSRRYASVTALAEDLQRYLDGLPVHAQPDTWSYRASKFVRRNQILVGATVAVILALSVGLGVALVQYGNALQSAADERTQSNIAKKLALLAQENQEHAQHQQTLALAAKENVVRLELDDLEESALKLWPATPDMIDAYQAWMVRAERLVASLPGQRSALQALEAPRSATVDGSAAGLDELETRWWRVQMTKLIAALEQFADPKTGCAYGLGQARGHGVSRRLESALKLQEQEREGSSFRALWEATRREIAAAPAYGGLDLPRQIDLMPLGIDPDSRLFEFAVIGSGSIPERDSAGRLKLQPSTTVVLVLIPAAESLVGRSEADQQNPNLTPWPKQDRPQLATVQLAPYFIGKYEVTQEQWIRWTRVNPSQFQAGNTYSGVSMGDRPPLERVSYAELIPVLRRNRLTLPTEAQWEHAARAGTRTAWWTGDDPNSLIGCANLLDEGSGMRVAREAAAEPLRGDDGFGFTAPVGSFKANAFGLHDVHGNVAEACLNFMGAQWDDLSEPSMEELATDLRRHPIRGGSWISSPTIARSDSMGYSGKDRSDSNIGARVCRRILD